MERNPALRFIGDKSALSRRKNAFFCSIRCPGNLILKAYDLARRWQAEGQPVIGGFHSPVEKEVLRILLRSEAQVCIVLARSLPKRIPKEFLQPIEDGRLLLVSPFDSKTKRASTETAARRNQVVASLADQIFVAYAAVGSKTEALCRDIASAGKPCMTFDDPRTANLKSAGFAVIPN
jgi:predicted Rossmann fold nucleotide-binding protein DprA/Smf involved in DNA uptake